MKEGTRARLQSELRKLIATTSKEQEVYEARLIEKFSAKQRRRPGEVDVWELFSGASLISKRAVDFGLQAGEPAELQYGWNLRLPAAREHALKYRRKVKPKLIIAGLECTKWCWYNVWVNYRHRPEELLKLQRGEEPFLDLLFDLFVEQVAEGNHMIIENPWSSAVWHHTIMKLLLQIPGVRLVKGAGCQFNFRGKQGGKIQKNFGFLATAAFAQVLERPCDCRRVYGASFRHELVQGANTRHSMEYTLELVDVILGRLWEIRQSTELMFALPDEKPWGANEVFNEKGLPLAWEVNYVDINRAEDEWRPVLDAAWSALRSVAVPSLLLHPDSEIRSWIARLVPWNIRRVQLAKHPKANRYPAETLATHRATVLVYNDDQVTFQTEKIADAYALNERFSKYDKPVRMGVFVFGDAPGEDSDQQVQQQVAEHHPPTPKPPDLTQELDNITKVDQSKEIWFHNLPRTVGPEIRSAIARMHNNMGHPSEAEMVRNLSFCGASSESLMAAKALRCAVCLRGRGRPVLSSRPARAIITLTFNEHVYMDIFYIEDATKHLHIAMGIIDEATGFHVVVRLDDRQASHTLSMFNLVWMSWAGPPARATLDQDAAFMGAFRRGMEFLGVKLDYVPKGGHHRNHKAERNNAVWRRTFDKMVDEAAIAGDVEVDLACTLVNHAKNNGTKKCGFSVSQAVFGKEARLPDELLGDTDETTNTQISLDARLQRRNEIRIAAVSAFHRMKLDESLRRGLFHQARPYRGDYASGDVVGYWRAASGAGSKYRRAGFIRGYVVGPGENDCVWVCSNGHMALVNKEQLRDAAGSEQWAPDEAMMKELKATELKMRKRQAEYHDDRGGEEPPAGDLADEALLPLADLPAEEAEATENVAGEAEQEEGRPRKQLRAFAPGVEGAMPSTPGQPAPSTPGLPVPGTPGPEVYRPSRAASSSSRAAPYDVGECSSTTPPAEPMPHDGWHRLPDQSWLHVGSLVQRPLRGKHKAKAQHYPTMSVWIRWSPEDAWTPYVQQVDREFQPRSLPQVAYSVAQVFHPPAKFAAEVNETTLLDEEIHFGGSDSEGEKDFIPRKVRKQLQKEIPWQMIPKEHRHLFEEAMRKEWRNWLTWKSVRVCSVAESDRIRADPTLANRIIGSRFAFRNKQAGKDVEELRQRGEPPVIARARLCGQGFTDPDKWKLRRDSPTASRLGVMFVLQVAASQGWCLLGGDATSAFMQGGADKQREQPLYMRPPRNGTLEGVDPNQLIEIIGSIYGLVNSPRLWYRVLAGFLVNEDGWKQHSMDVAVFMKFVNGVFRGVLAIHVDDIIAAVANELLLEPLRKKFDWGKGFARDTLDFTGKQIVREGGWVKVFGSLFAGAIETFRMPRERRAQLKDKLTAVEASELKSGIGTLSWAGHGWLPGIAAATSLCQGPEPCVETYLKVQSLLKEVKSSPEAGLLFVPLPLESMLTLVFADSSWANAENHKSQAAYICYLAEPAALTADGGYGSVVDWQSHRLKRSCQSTIYAEAMSSRAGACAGMWVQNFAREVMNENYRATDSVKAVRRDDVLKYPFHLHVVTDCYSLYQTVVRSGLPTDRRAAIEVLAIRELVTIQSEEEEDEDHDMRLREFKLDDRYHWCCSAEQKADVLTKMMTIQQRNAWRESLNWIVITPKATPSGPPRPSKPRPPVKIKEYQDMIIEEALQNDWTLG